MPKRDKLNKVRQYARQRCTKLCAKIAEECNSYNAEQKVAYIEKLQDIKAELNEFNKSSIDLCIDQKIADEEVEEEMTVSESYDDKILLCIAQLKEGSDSKTSPPPSDFKTVPQKLKLPEIPLPFFQ